MISDYYQGEISSSDNNTIEDEDYDDDDNQIITVKFRITESQIIAQVYSISLTINEIKNDIAKKFDIDNPNYLIISQFNEELSDACKLSDLNTNEFGIIEFDLKINDNILNETDDVRKPELNLKTYYSKFRLADFITVHIPAENSNDGIASDIVVEIQNQAITKPFLGGYRNIKTGVEYLNAYTQTGPSLNKIKTTGIYSRNSQTIEYQDKIIDTPSDASTQSFGDASHLIHIPSINDHIIIPRKYESYKDKCRRENKESKIRLLQKNWRCYLLRKYIQKYAAEYRQRMKEENNRQNKIMENNIEQHRKECITKIFPKTKEDFDLLYAQVQKWKENEIKKINSSHTGASRTAELRNLLDKEIQLINSIENKRNLVRKALKDYNDEKKLQKLGEPIKWTGYRGIIIEMDLLRTQKVRHLTEFYKKMKQKLSTEDRIQLLDKISETLENEGNTPQVYELLDLFEREKSLLMLLNQKCSFEALRKRQLTLFMEIIEYHKGQQKIKEEHRICEKCKKVKSIKDFALRTRQKTVDTCKRCFYLKGNISDNSLYTAILRSIQRDEKKKGSFTSYAFIMQEDDIRYLIDIIWHGHSILSKCDDISQLRLPRWNKNKEWSPWNCVCLTEFETRAHINMTNLIDVYTDNMIQEINTKHMTAKNAFKKLKEIDNDFTEYGELCKTESEEKNV